MSHTSNINLFLDFWQIAPLMGPENNAIKELFSDTFYYANVCPVCLKIRGEAQDWCYCKRCKLIVYCTPEHMQSDTFNHNSFCTEFHNWLEFPTPDYYFLKMKFIEPDDRINLLTEIVTFLEQKIHLRNSEIDIFKCMRRCEVCSECDPDFLKNCPRCPKANFCIQHSDDRQIQDGHAENACSSYTLCWILDLYEILFKDYDILGHLLLNSIASSEVTRQPLENIWNLFVKSPDVLQNIGRQCTLFGSRFNINENLRYLQCYISHFLSMSMTVMYGFENLGLLQNKEILIHVIGTTIYESQSLSQWELLLHCLPSLINLKIVFVGPELKQPEENKIPNICRAFNSTVKTLSFEFHNVLYQNYLDEQHVKNPSLVIAFNPGFIAYDSWKDCLINLEKRKSALIFTSYSKNDAEIDQKEIQEFLGHGTSYFYFGENPYCSLRPKRFIDPFIQAVVYKNAYITIYKSLSPQVQEEKDTNC